MIHNDIQNQLALLVKTSATPLIEVAKSATEIPEWTPGQRVPAHVLASLPNGRFHVMVEDQLLDMNLPQKTQPGDHIDLVYVTDKPRATFALLSDLAGLPSNKSNVSLSETGKFLGGLLQQTPKNAAGVATLTSAAPLTPGEPLSVQQLATTLKDAISQSGMFYESHQAQWVTGERSFDSLMREPQAKFSATASEQKVSQQPLVEEGKASVNNAIPASADKLDLSRLSNSTQRVVPDALNQTLATGIGGAATAHEPAHAVSAQIVQQQLEILDSRQLVWQGQVWPGQDMTWTIEEDGGRQASEVGDEAVWSTQLHLKFPTLGGITARLALGAKGIKIDFSASDANSVALMKTEAPLLAESMQSSGLNVVGLTVKQEDGA